jgi:hypothetical protein
MVRFRHWTTTFFAVVGLSACCSITTARTTGPSVRISSATVGHTNKRYASYNVDGSWNRGFFHIDWTNANLRAAAASLA